MELHTRLAATLVMADTPQTAEIAQALYRASQSPDNFGDPWLGRAVYIAATRHQQEFLNAYKADRNALPFSALSVPLRMGTLTPDWRMPTAAEVSAEWKDMTVPGNWEGKGLTGFDGTVWFTRTINLPAGAVPDTLALGPVRNTAQVWVNGLPLAAPPGGGRGGGGRGAGAPGASPAAPVLNLAAVARAADITLPIPAGALKTGPNVITVRVNNTQAEGGFVGAPADMYLAAGQARTPLAGAWKYRVERSANTGALYAKPGELAAHLAFTAAGGPASAAAAALPTVSAVPDVTIQLGVIRSEMKWAQTELTVQAGQMVELVFVNADEMPHNFVLGVPGSLQLIGAASDQIATLPNAAALNYTPDIPQILVKTALVNPGQTVRIQFRAPAEPGQYPYVCTFPAHWRLMNGILNVTAPPGRGGGGGGRGAAPAGRGAPAPAPAPAPPAGGRGQ